MAAPPVIEDYHLCKRCGRPIRNAPKAVPIPENIMVCRYCSLPAWKTRKDFLNRNEVGADEIALNNELTRLP